MKIRCIETRGSSFLTHGKIYEGVFNGKYHYCVTNDIGEISLYHKDKFMVVSEEEEKGGVILVKCIDNYGETVALSLGKVYEVKEDFLDCYVLKNIKNDKGKEMMFFKSRFEVVPSSENRDFCINVPTPELSKIVQEKLFELFYRWGIEVCDVQWTKEKFLYFGEDGKITHGHIPSLYGAKLITIEELFNNPESYKLNHKMVMVEGKEFKENVVKEALKLTGKW